MNVKTMIEIEEDQYNRDIWKDAEGQDISFYIAFWHSDMSISLGSHSLAWESKQFALCVVLPYCSFKSR